MTDTDYGLRSFVEALDAAGELERLTEPTPLRDVARITETSDRAVLIERPGGCEVPLLANAMASRACWAIALGVPASEITAELARRVARPFDPVRVDDGPVKAIVQVGDEVDITRLPAHLQHELDGAPYISASMDVSRDPETGRYNTGVRRLMVRGPRETGVDMVAPSDLRGFYRRARAAGKRFEIAFVVGAHPLDYMSSQMRVPPTDEFAVMGALRQAPVPLVACETIDLLVPADAEIVMEGYIDGDWEHTEGPYGEYTGCYGAPHRNPLFKVTAITRRSDAIFQTATIGGRRLDHTDTAVMCSLSTELAVWEAITRGVSQPVAVHCPPAGTGLHHTRIAVKVRDPGDGRNAIVAALGSNADTKMAIVVDEDIDVFSDAMVEWALATRYQADQDTIVLGGLRTLPLDPSLPPHEGSAVTTAKLGMDATRRLDRPAHVFDIPAPPFTEATAPGRADERDDDVEVEALALRVLETVGEGRRFVDWLREWDGVHEGDLVRALAVLRSRDMIAMDTTGRYCASSPAREAEEVG
jgi:2,5-furandicarboxylate decarboxylase 1